MESEGSFPYTQELLLVSILSHMDATRILPSYFRKIHSNIILPSTPRSYEWTLPFRFSTKISYAFLISSMRAACSIQLILLDFIAVIFGEDYELRRSTLRSVLHPPATPSL